MMQLISFLLPQSQKFPVRLDGELDNSMLMLPFVLKNVPHVLDQKLKIVMLVKLLLYWQKMELDANWSEIGSKLAKILL